jgi:hypothetical protein
LPEKTEPDAKDRRAIEAIRAAQPKTEAAIEAGRYSFIEGSDPAGLELEQMLQSFCETVRLVHRAGARRQRMRILLTYDRDIR